MTVNLPAQAAKALKPSQNNQLADILPQMPQASVRTPPEPILPSVSNAQLAQTSGPENQNKSPTSANNTETAKERFPEAAEKSLNQLTKKISDSRLSLSARESDVAKFCYESGQYKPNLNRFHPKDKMVIDKTVEDLFSDIPEAEKSNELTYAKRHVVFLEAYDFSMRGKPVALVNTTPDKKELLAFAVEMAKKQEPERCLTRFREVYTYFCSGEPNGAGVSSQEAKQFAGKLCESKDAFQIIAEHKVLVTKYKAAGASFDDAVKRANEDIFAPQRKPLGKKPLADLSDAFLPKAIA